MEEVWWGTKAGVEVGGDEMRWVRLWGWGRGDWEW